MFNENHKVLAQGRRVRIRTFSRRDVDSWLDWPQQTDPLYLSSYPHPMGRWERDNWFNERSNRYDYMMFALDDMQGRLVGLLTLRNIDRNRIQATLGLTMRPEALGQGYGTDSLYTFLGHFFGPLGFDIMLLDVAAYNKRAQRVYEKCGFTYFGDHWGYFDDYSIFNDPKYAPIRHLFRRNGIWLETLFYDMSLRRNDYLRMRSLGHNPYTFEPNTKARDPFDPYGKGRY